MAKLDKNLQRISTFLNYFERKLRKRLQIFSKWCIIRTNSDFRNPIKFNSIKGEKNEVY